MRAGGSQGRRRRFFGTPDATESDPDSALSFSFDSPPARSLVKRSFGTRVQMAGYGDSSNPITVLIVGDNAPIADLTLTVLAELGPSGVTVRDVAAAVAYLNQFGPEVAAVVADGDLNSDLTGLEFARFARIAWPHLRVAVTTNAASQERRCATLADGIERFSTPIMPLDVVTFLQDVSASAREAA